MKIDKKSGGKIQEIIDSGKSPTMYNFAPSTLIFGFGRKKNIRGHKTANQWQGGNFSKPTK